MNDDADEARQIIRRQNLHLRGYELDDATAASFAAQRTLTRSEVYAILAGCPPPTPDARHETPIGYPEHIVDQVRQLDADLSSGKLSNPFIAEQLVPWADTHGFWLPEAFAAPVRLALAARPPEAPPPSRKPHPAQAFREAAVARARELWAADRERTIASVVRDIAVPPNPYSAKTIHGWIKTENPKPPRPGRPRKSGT